jgi:hypothetical protein
VATSLSTAGAIGAGVGSAALFWRERSKRSRQLIRMEKELNAESLGCGFVSVSTPQP